MADDRESPPSKSVPGSEPGPPEIGGDLGLSRTIEALLFVADRALSPQELSEATDAPPGDVQAAIEALIHAYDGRGIVIIDHRGSYRMVSAPDLGEFCRRLLGVETRTRLSRAALETLGVIAYRQPVSRVQIERIRGVDSDSPLATLLARSLIEETGRLDAPGRPAQFGTTDMFLAYFGIPSLDALPDVHIPPPEDVGETKPTGDGPTVSGGSSAS